MRLMLLPCLVLAAATVQAAEEGVRMTVQDDERMLESKEMLEMPSPEGAEGKAKLHKEPRFRFQMPAKPGYSGKIIQCKKKYWGVTLGGKILDLGGKDQPARLSKELLHGGADDAMQLLGYAADGFPVYNDMAPKDPKDLHSPLRRMVPGYRKAGDGESFEYVGILGDLDECNGREGVTPEYPLGTYYYVISLDYPYVPRCWKGSPDPSFRPQEKPKPGSKETATPASGSKPPKPDDPF
jgi:hypothetical protein